MAVMEAVTVPCFCELGEFVVDIVTALRRVFFTAGFTEDDPSCSFAEHAAQTPDVNLRCYFQDTFL
jgi:hypothetical protein